MAHAAPFVVKGSKRIQSSFSEEIPNVSYLTPQNKVILILMNNSKQTLSFKDRLRVGGQPLSFSSPDWLPET